MLKFNRCRGLFFIFLVVSAKVDKQEEETKRILMQFIHRRHEFLRNVAPEKPEYRMFSNSTVNDDEEVTSRCIILLTTIIHCSMGLLGWGCGICGWGCGVIGRVLNIFKRKPNRPGPIPPSGNWHLPSSPAPRPGSNTGGGRLPGNYFSGYMWGHLQTTLREANCLVFNGCPVPERKKHENHYRPSAGRRGRR
ncbi:hypothetical protein ILUMI_04506 [Ignelater luminosus]|uniref:Uncharacterized protein n=1 Tax=Ignelater luminosus TaxID=2038154 RepID=A0A8K0GL49_IGNLU|nr:hypothetical protein ILUMI_04506 [Ignelater luminosus]